MAGKGQSNAGVEFHKGVFSAPSFITIGDQYGKKVTGDARQGGKTMMTHPALLGTMGSALAQGDQSVYFDREFRYVNKGSKYVESLPARIGLTQVRDEKRSVQPQRYPLALIHFHLLLLSHRRLASLSRKAPVCALLFSVLGTDLALCCLSSLHVYSFHVPTASVCLHPAFSNTRLIHTSHI